MARRGKQEESESKLGAYHAMRDFERTAEPAGAVERSATGRLYVMQKHAARRLHYDLRLELDGVLKSWAVPRGPSLDPQQKPLAVQTEDHPIEYAAFEGIIPKGEYGGGTVMVWDRGEWEPIGDPHEGLAKGDLKFMLRGEKLRGEFVLARMTGKQSGDGRNWLLIKKKDDEARPIGDYNVLGESSRSVLTERSLEEIEQDADRMWKDGRVQGAAQGRRRKSTAIVLNRAAESIPGAREVEMPDHIGPQLAVPAKHAPEGDDWIHEIKLDGYRLVSYVAGSEVRILTRNGNDWTERFPGIVRALKRTPADRMILDGEVVVLDDRGVADFQLLQNAFRSRRRSAAFSYFVFDLMYLDGVDLRGAGVVDRKLALERAFEGSPEAVVQYCDHIRGRGPIVFAEAKKSGLEGIISKRADARYLSKRSDSWLKIKCTVRQEFVVGGFTDPSGSRPGFGALLLGCYDDDEQLVYHGRVGTGFSDDMLESLREQLHDVEIEASPFANPEKDPDHRKAHWVSPEMVVEVEFSNWTHDDLIRHPSFQGVREDKDARDVRRERAGAEPEPPRVVRAPRDLMIAGVKISNPGRTVYPDDGVTKREVAAYYEAVGERMLRFVKGRLLAIVRCPLGLAGESFYQRELGKGWPEAIRGIPIGGDHALVVNDVKGLVSLAQMGTLEIHTWQCRADNTERPDQLVFDLDPGRGIEWEHIVAAANFVRDYLDELGLESFVKTTGGSGVHLLVPIVRRTRWEDVKSFTLHVARDLAKIAPKNFIATMSKDLRKGRIYIDYLRNQEGATSVAAFSTRARNGATVSTPLAWDELSADLTPRDLNVRSVLERMSDSSYEPWEGYFDTRQFITKDMMRRVGMK